MRSYITSTLSKQPWRRRVAVCLSSAVGQDAPLIFNTYPNQDCSVAEKYSYTIEQYAVGRTGMWAQSPPPPPPLLAQAKTHCIPKM